MSTFRKIEPENPKKFDAEVPRKDIYPRFSIDLKHLPEAKKWEIKKKYGVSFELEMTGIEIGERYSNVSFEIKAIRVDSKVKDMSKKEFGDYQTKVRSGQV